MRVERIITGTEVTLSYYCGACEHTWQITAPDPQYVRVTLIPKKDRRQSVDK